MLGSSGSMGGGLRLCFIAGQSVPLHVLFLYHYKMGPTDWHRTITGVYCALSLVVVVMIHKGPGSHLALVSPVEADI